MDFLRFMLRIAVASTVLVIVLRIFTWLFALIIAASSLFSKKTANISTYLMKGITYYMTAGVICMITLDSLPIGSSLGFRSLFGFAGCFIVWVLISGGMAEGRERAAAADDFAGLKMMRFDGLFLIGAILIYLIMLFSPSIASNFATEAFFRLTNWAWNLPVVGSLMALAGGIFLVILGIGTIYSAGELFLLGVAVLVSFARKLRKS